MMWGGAVESNCQEQLRYCSRHDFLEIMPRLIGDTEWESLRRRRGTPRVETCSDFNRIAAGASVPKPGEPVFPSQLISGTLPTELGAGHISDSAAVPHHQDGGHGMAVTEYVRSGTVRVCLCIVCAHK